MRTDQSFIGYSYSSCGPLTFNFGLADHIVDSVEFFWPSGLRTVMLDPAVDVSHGPRTPCLGLSPELDWPLEAELCPGLPDLPVPDGWTASWTGGVDGAEGRLTEPGTPGSAVGRRGGTVLSPALDTPVIPAQPLW